MAVFVDIYGHEARDVIPATKFVHADEGQRAAVKRPGPKPNSRAAMT